MSAWGKKIKIDNHKMDDVSLESEGIYRLPISTPFPVGKVNIYFVVSPTPTLIDTPPRNPLYLYELESALNRIGYSIRGIKRVIITHPHIDHFGLASTISEKSGAEVWVFKGAIERFKNFEKEAVETIDFLTSVLKKSYMPEEIIDYSKKIFYDAKGFGCEVEPSKSLEDGESIRLSGRTFNVIHMPGHTPWCILLYNIEKGLAFTGDFLLKDISSNALIQKPSHAPEGYKSLKYYISSLKKARDLGIETALPGHGEIIVNPLERVDELLSFIESRKEEVLSVIRRGVKTVFQIVEVLFPSLPMISCGLLSQRL